MNAVDTPSRLTHDALFYDSDEEFVAALTPFVRGGLAAGHAVVAAVTRANTALLRDALGADADAVVFLDRDDWYRRPTSTIVGWQRILDEAVGRGHWYVRLIGEVAFGPSDRHPAWTRYEAALNSLFAAAPAWIVCPYDTRVLTEEVVRDACRTHSVVIDPFRRVSDDYVPPEELLRTVREPLPPVAGPPRIVMVLEDEHGVAAARAATRSLFTSGGEVSGGEVSGGLDWPRGPREDAVLVVSEIAANSLRHGRGRRELRIWVQGQVLVGEVTDEGPGPADPLVGYRHPVGESPSSGWGLWTAQQLCDALAIEHRDGVTRVRFVVTDR